MDKFVVLCLEGSCTYCSRSAGLHCRRGDLVLLMEEGKMESKSLEDTGHGMGPKTHNVKEWLIGPCCTVGSIGP